MTKIFMLSIALIGFSAQAANQNIGPAGCGLGNQVMGGKENQVLASTTNGTFYSQVFAITFGTSNCIDGKSGQASLPAFVEANQAALSADIARGEGETLASLSVILGCENRPELNRTLKQSYSRIFSKPKAEYSEISRGIRKSVQSNPRLASSCQRLG